MIDDQNYRTGGEHGSHDAEAGKGKRYVVRNLRYALKFGLYLPGGIERWGEYWRAYNERYEDFIRWKAPMQPKGHDSPAAPQQDTVTQSYTAANLNIKGDNTMSQQPQQVIANAAGVKEVGNIIIAYQNALITARSDREKALDAIRTAQIGGAAPFWSDAALIGIINNLALSDSKLKDIDVAMYTVINDIKKYYQTHF